MNRNFAELEKQRSKLASEQSTHRGSKQALEGQAAVCSVVSTQVTRYQAQQADLTSTTYKDIDERHRDCLINLKTTEMASSDLNKYYGALDRYFLAFDVILIFS